MNNKRNHYRLEAKKICSNFQINKKNGLLIMILLVGAFFKGIIFGYLIGKNK